MCQNQHFLSTTLYPPLMRKKSRAEETQNVGYKRYCKRQINTRYKHFNLKICFVVVDSFLKLIITWKVREHKSNLCRTVDHRSNIVLCDCLEHKIFTRCGANVIVVSPTYLKNGLSTKHDLCSTTKHKLSTIRHIHFRSKIANRGRLFNCPPTCNAEK